MVEVHHVLGHVRLLFHQLVVEATAEHAEHADQVNLLLVQGAGHQHILVLVVAHDHDVGFDRLDAQHQVGEVARGRGVLQDFLDFNPDSGELARQHLGRAGAELGVLVHDDGCFGDAACCLVDFGQTAERVIHAFAIARCQAKHILQAA